MTARWCGSCGAALATEVPAGPPPPDVPSGRRISGWLQGVAAALTVGLMGLGVWALVGGGPDVSADGDVAVPDPDVLGTPDPGAPTGTSAPSLSRMACAPAGCQVWRVDEPSGLDVIASEGLVLHMQREQTTAYDSTTGQVRWRRPTPASASRNPRLTAVSPEGVAFVHGRTAAPAPDPSRWPVRVSIHDPVDGSHRVDVELDPGVVQRLFWVDDRLVVVLADMDRPVASTVALTPTGEVAWQRTGTGVVWPVTGAGGLLADDPETLALIDPTDGRVRWQVDGTLVTRSEGAESLVVHDGAAQVLRIVTAATGEVQRVVDVPAARGVVAFGPWVLVGSGDTVRVLDPATGHELFTRPDPTPAAEGERDAPLPPGLLRVSRAVQAGERVVVAWGDATSDAGIELAVHGRDGTLQGTVTVPVDAVMGGGIGLHDVAGRDGVVLVHLTTGAGPEGSIAAVDLQAREVLGVMDGRLVASDDDLLAIRQDDGVSIIGPVGRLQVRHVRHVAALDPLVVHGAGGIMRLDRSLAVGDAGG